MLAPDVRFEGFTSQDWERVLELFQPLRRDSKARDDDRPQGGVIAVHHRGRLSKLLHSEVGRLRLDDVADDWPLTAEQLARRHHASWALLLERGALDDVMESFGAAASRDHDLTDQWLLLLSLVREQRLNRRVDLWPRRLEGVPIPTRPMIERSLDMVCPPGRSMLLGLFERGELWTCIALSRGLEGIDLILGPDELRHEMGPLSGDMRRDHRHLAHAVADRSRRPLSLGCFSNATTFRALEVDPTPGAWALAVAVRDVVLYPVPPAMAVPLGLDAGRAAFEAIRGVMTRFDAAGVFTPAFNTLRDVAVGDRPMDDVLGFDPLTILRKLLSREH